MQRIEFINQQIQRCETQITSLRAMKRQTYDVMRQQREEVYNDNDSSTEEMKQEVRDLREQASEKRDKIDSEIEQLKSQLALFKSGRFEMCKMVADEKFTKVKLAVEKSLSDSGEMYTPTDIEKQSLERINDQIQELKHFINRVVNSDDYESNYDNDYPIYYKAAELGIDSNLTMDLYQTRIDIMTNPKKALKHFIVENLSHGKISPENRSKVHAFALDILLSIAQADEMIDDVIEEIAEANLSRLRDFVYTQIRNYPIEDEKKAVVYKYASELDIDQKVADQLIEKQLYLCKKEILKKYIRGVCPEYDLTDERRENILAKGHSLGLKDADIEKAISNVEKLAKLKKIPLIGSLLVKIRKVFMDV